MINYFLKLIKNSKTNALDHSKLCIKHYWKFDVLVFGSKLKIKSLPKITPNKALY